MLTPAELTAAAAEIAARIVKRMREMREAQAEKTAELLKGSEK